MRRFFVEGKAPSIIHNFDLAPSLVILQNYAMPDDNDGCKCKFDKWSGSAVTLAAAMTTLPSLLQQFVFSLFLPLSPKTGKSE